MGACYQTCNLVHVARELKFWVFGTKFVQNILNFARKPFKKRMVNKGMKTVKAILYVEIGTGNPGVFRGYPYPYPRKPIPQHWGTGFTGLGSGVRTGLRVLRGFMGFCMKT